ncbi:MAG TPA: caspase family protein [Longimicrobiales bacterium]
MRALRGFGPAALIALLAPAAVAAQLVRFESDMPRVMVFLDEEGATAATQLTRFLREAEFEVIDPAFAKEAAQQELARRALAGDQAAAVELGRDLGAQVIIFGDVTADAAPNPMDATLQVGTARLDVRALRLDQPRIVATGSTSGRAPDATPAGARNSALARAAEQLLYSSAFLGDILNDWEARPFEDEAYWQPEPQSVPAMMQAVITPVAAPAVVSSSTAVAAPAPAAGAQPLGVVVLASEPIATRGIGAVRRDDARPGTVNVRVRGVVSDPAAAVMVGGAPATVRASTADEQARLGVPRTVGIFDGVVDVASASEAVRVVAAGNAGAQAEVIAYPRIGQRWAVIIGISDYADDRISDLDFADDDALAMAEFLRSPAGGAVPESNMRLLVNQDATSDAIREAMFVFLQQARPEDLVTIYVASHGSPDPSRPENLYILSHDADLDALASTAFPMWDFKTALRRQIEAERVVVFTDACHSGGTIEADENPVGGAFAELFSPSRRVTLSAADAHELSHEGREWGGGHGAFTFLLLEGLRGAADADQDARVTFPEAAAYVQQRVAAATGGIQNPQQSGLGEVVLSEL